MKQRCKAKFIILVAAVSYAMLSLPAMAQATGGSGELTDLMSLILSAAKQWDSILRQYALSLFWGLAGIQLIWTMMPLVFKQADFGEIAGELFKYCLVTGFFLFLLTDSASLATAVVDSFRQAGAAAAGASKALEPGDIFFIAVNFAIKIGNVNTYNPFVAISTAAAAALCLLSFAFIAGFMALTIIESYVVINASVLFMGFGASQWTREYSLSIMRYAVSVGAKLFILTLLVGIVVKAANDWANAYQAGDNASMWTMVGLALVCAYLCRTIPDLVQGVIGGASTASGGHIGELAAAAVTGGVAGAAAGSEIAKSMLSSGGAGGSGLAEAAGGAMEAGTGGGGGSMPGTGGSDTAGHADAPQKPADSSPKSFAEVQAGKAARAGQTGGDKSGSATASTSKASASAAKSDSESDNKNSTRDNVNAALKGAGMMAAIAVPGMAGAANLSLGPGGPQPVPKDNDDESGSMAPSEPENTISAAGSAESSAPPTSSAQSANTDPNAGMAFREAAVDAKDAEAARVGKPDDRKKGKADDE